jgi:F420-0:gamma-glutamyl ligase
VGGGGGGGLVAERAGAAVRQRIEEIREQIAGLESLLEVEEDRLSRLEVTRETVEAILGEVAELVEEPLGEVEAADAVAAQAVPRGVVTVPPWRPGMTVGVLPQVYRDAVEIMTDAGGALRAGQVLVAMGWRTRRPSGRDYGPSSSGWWNANGCVRRGRGCSRWPRWWPAWVTSRRVV